MIRVWGRVDTFHSHKIAKTTIFVFQRCTAPFLARLRLQTFFLSSLPKTHPLAEFGQPLVDPQAARPWVFAWFSPTARSRGPGRRQSTSSEHVEQRIYKGKQNVSQTRRLKGDPL